MKNADYFSQYVTEDFEQYINRKRADQCYGNNIEMQAVAEMYNRVIEVYEYSTGEGSERRRGRGKGEWVKWEREEKRKREREGGEREGRERKRRKERGSDGER